MADVPRYFSRAEISDQSPNAIIPQGMAQEISEPNFILSRALEYTKNKFEDYQKERDDVQDMLDTALAASEINGKFAANKIMLEEVLRNGRDEEGNPLDYKGVLQNYVGSLDSIHKEVVGNYNLRPKVKAALVLKAANERQKFLIDGYETVDKYHTKYQQETFSDAIDKLMIDKDYGVAIGTIKGAYPKLITDEQRKNLINKVYEANAVDSMDHIMSIFNSTGKPMDGYKYIKENRDELRLIRDNEGKVVGEVDDKVVESYLSKTRADIRFKESEVSRAKQERKDWQERNFHGYFQDFIMDKLDVDELNAAIVNGHIETTKGEGLIEKFIARQEKINGQSKKEKTEEEKNILDKQERANYSYFRNRALNVALGKESAEQLEEDMTKSYINLLLTGEHYNKCLKDMEAKDDKKDPLNNQIIKNKLESMERLHKAKFFGEGNEGEINFVKKYDQFIDWARENPKATTDQIEKQYEVIFQKEIKKGFGQAAKEFFGFSSKKTKEDLVSKYFSPENKAWALETIALESTNDPNALNPKDTNGLPSYGYMQVNGVHIPDLVKEGIIKEPNDLFDPETNLKAAAYVFKKQGPTAWGTNKDNRYKSSWDKTIPGYGNREDGTPKGRGWLGELTRKDGSGMVSTELSLSGVIDGKKVLFPALVPTLDKNEIDYLLSHKDIPDTIKKKAADFAKKRIKEGRSPFVNPEEMKEAIDWLGRNGRAINDANVNLYLKRVNEG